MAERAGRTVLHLDRFRVVVAVFAVGAVVILAWLIVLTGKVNREEAEKIAHANAEYAVCIQKIPFFNTVNVFFRQEGSPLRVPVPTRAECERQHDEAEP